MPIKKAQKAVETTLKGEGVSNAEVECCLHGRPRHSSNEQRILKPRLSYGCHYIPPNETPLEGEIYIGAETAVKQAEEYNVSLTNELLRLVIHGSLHLCGYDDATDDERHHMHLLEIIFRVVMKQVYDRIVEIITFVLSELKQNKKLLI